MPLRCCVRLRPRANQFGRWHPTTRRFTRNFSEDHLHRTPQELLLLHPVRILGPTLWSIAAICTICFSSAAYDVYQDAKGYSKRKRGSFTFEQIQEDRAAKRVHDVTVPLSNSNRGPIVASSPLGFWHEMSESGKVIASVTGINVLTFGISRVPSTVAQTFHASLAHTPAEGAFRYRQLLTSAFVHTGLVHLGMNMLVLYNFAPKLAESPTFKGSGSHTLAFYLSSGIFSALVSQVSCNFRPNKMDRFRPGMGFSGVAYAIAAAWCVEYSDARVTLYLVPWTNFTPAEFLAGIAVWEMAGAVGLLQFFPLRIAHTAHLGGIVFGAAYAAYASGERCWTPFRRAAFRGLKAVGAI